MGPWQFGAGLNLGYGDFDDTRVVVDGSAPSVMLTSDYDVTTVAGRLRAAYEIPFEHGYVRPRADLDVIYTYVPGHAETGASGTALEVDQADQTIFALTPAVEVAGRFDGTGGFILRPYATLGVRFLSDDAWTVDARLQGAQAEAGTFESSTAMPDTLADLHLGLQVFQVQGWELNLEYGLQAGDDYVGQAASGRVAYRF
jgi:outer membrane autotransporter protein